MTWLPNGQPTEDWIEENHPENGVFRVYWTNVKERRFDRFHKPIVPGATLDPEEGEGLRFEWYYKDGKRADGVSKGWHENGQLKQEQTWKDGKFNGRKTDWHDNGQKSEESYWENDKIEGLCTFWDDNGQKWKEETFKDGEKINTKYYGKKQYHIKDKRTSGEWIK